MVIFVGRSYPALGR